MISDKRVVVTGGAGFIGSNIAVNLSHDNEVVVVDDLSTGKAENLSGAEIDLVRGSITDLDLLKKVFLDTDYVFHQAALASIPASISDPVRSNDVNANGTLNVLVAANETDVKKVVFASTSAIYGDSEQGVKVETIMPRPLSPYAVTKLAGEYYCKVFHKTYGLATVALRYFNVYGPKQDPSSEYAAVIPKFLSRVSNDRAPIIYGDGAQTRDFVYVKDVVTANIRAAVHNKADGETINVASGKAITINELASIVMEASGMKEVLDIEYREPRVGDVRDSLGDITKSGKLMDYMPEYDLRKGLEETIDWFKHYNPKGLDINLV